MEDNTLQNQDQEMAPEKAPVYQAHGSMPAQPKIKSEEEADKENSNKEKEGTHPGQKPGEDRDPETAAKPEDKDQEPAPIEDPKNEEAPTGEEGAGEEGEPAGEDTPPEGEPAA